MQLLLPCVLKTLILCFSDGTSGVSPCAWNGSSHWFVSQSDPHLISSKDSAHGLNPAKSTKLTLTSFWSSHFSFFSLFISITDRFFLPPFIFFSYSPNFFYSVNRTELVPLAVSRQTVQVGDYLETMVCPNKQMCLLEEATMLRYDP